MIGRLSGFFLFCILGASLTATAEPPGGRKDLVDLSGSPGLFLDVRYATSNNFTGANVYGDFKQCWLHEKAAPMLEKAAALLQKEKPGWKLLVFDCLRPRNIQRRLWDVVKGTPQQKYVADPEKGSIHNYGFAIDLSLRDAEGREVDMGTPFDFFGELAEPRLEGQLLSSGKLTRQQINNRLILRRAMTEAGFIQLSIEWWHYEALGAKKVRAEYAIVE